MNFSKALKVLFIAGVYFALAVTSLQYSFHSSNATPIWPASGFAFAILLLWGPQFAMGVFIGAVSANLFVFLNNDTCPVFTAIWVSGLIGIGNMTEAIAGYYLLRKFVPAVQNTLIFRYVSSVISFVFVSLIMCLPSCVIGTTATYLGGIVPATDFFSVLFTWWTGDVSGILLLTPFLIVIFHEKLQIRSIAKPIKLLEAGILILGIVVISSVVFHNLFSPQFIFTQSFVITPLLILAAVRFDSRLLTSVIIISAAIAIAGTMGGTGPFRSVSLNESLLTVEAFVSINSVMVLLLHAAMTERREKEISLQAARNNLENIVMERTKELHEKNKQLVSRNSELASFSYAASHDLQEPLRKIEFFSSMILQSEKEFSGKGKDSIKRIHSTTLRMKQLIENLLSYSLVDSDKKLSEKTDLNQILLEVKNELFDTIQETEAIIDSGILPEVKVVPFQFHQLLANILNNSLKFRKRDTRLHIIIEWEIMSGLSLQETEADASGSYFHLSFSDNGIGFEQEYADKIFEILQRLHGKSEYEGTGIGLAICKKIVENHKGFISATGEPGKGSTIHIYLPVDIVDSETNFKNEEKKKKGFL